MPLPASLLATLAALAVAAPVLAVATSAHAGGPASREVAARTIRGHIVDRGGAPVVGAIVDVDGATATTGDDGAFELAVADAAARTLTVYADGFDVAVATARGGRRPLRIALAASDAEIIEIADDAPEEAEPARREMGVDEIRRLPGAGNDALRALQAMPGFARIPFGLGGLVVRGTSPRDTGVFIDGVRVPLAFHFGGLTSFYPSSMLDRLEVTPGAVGAPWGRVAGGVVELGTRRGRSDRWRVGGEIGVLDSSVHADGPTRLGAVTVGFRRSYIDGILAVVLPPEDRILPRYTDAQLRLDGGDATDRGAWTASIFASDDAMTASGDDGGGFYLGFVRAMASYHRRLGGTSVKITPWLGYDRVAFEDDSDGGAEDPVLRRVSVPMGGRVEVSRDLGRGFVAAGVDIEGGRSGPTSRRVENDFTGVDQQFTTESRWSADLGLWTESLWHLGGDAMILRPGVRVDHFGLIDEWALSPRLGVSHVLSDTVTLRESVGLQFQPPVAADLEEPTGNPDLGAMDALHAAVGAEVQLPAGLTLSATGYVIASHRLPTYVPRQRDPFDDTDDDVATGTGLGAVIAELFEAQLGSFSYRENIGRGRNLGLELELHRRVGRVTGWVAYTWSKARRQGGPSNPEWRPYTLDQPHVLNAVVSTPVGRWQLGARLRVASGNPVAVTEPGGDFDDPVVVGYDRLPTFIALDLRVDRSWKRSWGTISAYLDIQNATNRDNVEDAYVDDDDGTKQYVHGLPILPLFGVEYRPNP